MDMKEMLASQSASPKLLAAVGKDTLEARAMRSTLDGSSPDVGVDAEAEAAVAVASTRLSEEAETNTVLKGEGEPLTTRSEGKPVFLLLEEALEEEDEEEEVFLEGLFEETEGLEASGRGGGDWKSSAGILPKPNGSTCASPQYNC